MSKPRIYGRCQAGCEWETVHKSEFERSATFIQQYPVNNRYYLDPFHQYKIESESTNSAYNAYPILTYKDGTTTYWYTFTIDEFDAYRGYYNFEILSFTATATTGTIVWEVNGNRYTDSISGTALDITNAELQVYSATAVYMFNNDACTAAVDGKGFETLATFSIPTNIWTDLSEKAPFTKQCSVTVQLSGSIDPNCALLISFGNLVERTNAGVAVAGASGSSSLTILFYAVNTPTDTITGSIGGIV